MFLEAMTWMDVERYLAHDDRIVVITGACEQHGYVSLLSDILAPMAIAKAAIEQEPVLVAPPLPFGISPYFTAYPGTISLRVETFAIVVRELLTGLVSPGLPAHPRQQRPRRQYRRVDPAAGGAGQHAPGDAI